MWIYFKLFTIATTVFTLPFLKDPFWKPKEFIFIVGALIFIALCLFFESNYRYNFNNKWISLLLIWVSLSFGWYFLRHIYFAGDKTHWNIWTITQSLNVIVAIMLFYHLVEYTDTLERWLSIVKVVCWLGFGLAVYSIFQYFGFDQIFRNGGRNVVINEGEGQVYYMFTLFGNKMLTSNYLACVIPLFLIFNNKKYLIPMGVSIVALCLFKSVFNIGAALLGVLIVLILQGKWKICLGLIFIAVVLLVVFWDKTNGPEQLLGKYSFNGRTDYWQTTLKKSMDKFITGHGLGSLHKDFTVKVAEQPGIFTRHSSHNIFIDIFYELGLGVIFVIGYLCSLIKRCLVLFANRKETMLLIGLLGGLGSYFLMSMGSFPHKIAPLALLGIIYIAGIEVHLSKRRKIV